MTTRECAALQKSLSKGEMALFVDVARGKKRKRDEG